MKPSPSRRTVLTAGATALMTAGAAGLAGCSGSSTTPRRSSAGTSGAEPTGTSSDVAAGGPTFEPADWAQVRAQFPLDPALAQFAAFVLAAHPRPVAAAIERSRRALDRDTQAVLETEPRRDAAVRSAIGSYLEVPPGEIALTDSTTMGLALTYRGLHLEPGDHVLTSTHEFYSTYASLDLVTAATGAGATHVPMYDDPATATEATMVGRIRDAILPATRVVALTWVHSSTGVRIPVRAIADVLAKVNRRRTEARRIVFCLDSVHGLGAVDATAPELGCDVMMAGTHKWVFGPRGTGMVWTSSEVASRIRPVIPTFDADLHPGPQLTPGGYKAFEHRWAVADAISFHNTIGRHRVPARITMLADQLKAGLARLPQVRLVTPRDPRVSAGIVCCDVAGMSPDAVVQRLRRDHGIVASRTPYAVSYVRFGTSMLVGPAEVDRLLTALGTFR
jgi:selenocysteine lyase/cysteine desulfurase